LERKPFRNWFFNGLAAIGQGWHDIIAAAVPRRRTPWRYEDHFGTDAEMIARDWQAVGDDLRHAIKEELGEADEDETTPQ
jgi:hypothetical protein